MTLCTHDICINNIDGICRLNVCKHITDYNQRMQILNSNTHIFIVNGKVYTNISTVARKLDIDERSLREYLKQDKSLNEAIELCQEKRRAEKEELRKESLDKKITDKRVEKAQEELGNLSLDDIINKAKSDDFGKDQP